MKFKKGRCKFLQCGIEQSHKTGQAGEKAALQRKHGSTDG